CHICHKSYQSPVQLKRHLRRHAEDKKHLCPFCKKGFSDQFDLKRHVRIHTGIKPFRCKLCNRAFAQRCSLELHCQKSHGTDAQYKFRERREKVYVCETCGFTAKEIQPYHEHLLSHKGDPSVIFQPKFLKQ
ncbi:uncharacterized protein TRIADDRAFT_24667, partial [Trichoplax adhaerens]